MNGLCVVERATYNDSGSQPERYCRDKYLLASGTLVIFRDSASYRSLRPVRRATAHRLTASEIGAAFKKLLGDCGPPLAAAIH